MARRRNTRQSAEPATDDPMVAALLREREGYEARGLKERVKAVDEQLKLRGHTDDNAPRGRRSQPAQTASSDSSSSSTADAAAGSASSGDGTEPPQA